MTTQKFSKREAIRFGWNTMKSNLGFFIGLLIICWALLYAIPDFLVFLAGFLAWPLGGLTGKVMEAVFLVLILRIVVFVALKIVITMGLVKISLGFCDKEKGKLDDLFSQYRLFFKYLFAFILYGLIVSGPIALLTILMAVLGVEFWEFWGRMESFLILIVFGAVPGIIWGIKFRFFDYFVVDKKAGPIEALKRSYAITTGVKWDLFVFSLMLVGINLLGVLCLLIGLFATIPTTIVAWAFVYRKLLAQTEIAPVSETSSEGISEWRPTIT